MATPESPDGISTPTYKGKDRRQWGDNREFSIESFLDGDSNPLLPNLVYSIAEGFDTQRLVLFMYAEGTPGVELPAADDKGIITGPMARLLMRGQWEVARSQGALVVFYEDPEELQPKIFGRTTESPAKAVRANMQGSVDHARIVHLPGDITMAQALPSHDYSDYEDRVNGVDGKSLGFGDKKEGILNADAMAVALHVQGQGWMEHAELLPLMKLAVHPNMQALHYGSALFEGMGCERDPNTGEVCIFDLEGHYNRMRNGANDLELPCPTFEVFKEMAIKMVQANARFVPPAGKGRLYLRPNLFSIGPWMKVGNSNVTALVFTATPIGNASAYFGSVEEEMVFGVPTNQIRSTRLIEVGKDKVAGNYAGTIRTIHVMEELGLKGGVAYLDRSTEEEDDLSNAEFKETSASNLVAFRRLEGDRWRVVTPPLNDGDILSGRTRALLKRIVEKFGWEFAEEPVTWADIQFTKYEFMAGSGTAAYLTPIHAFQRVEIGSREGLELVDEAALAQLATDDEKRSYREKRVGKKVGELVHLLGREPNKDAGELFPEPLKLIVAEMERVKRGEADDEPEYKGLITRVTLPERQAA
ncbi:MAG: hypothetical protein WCW30_00650 [Candidatus Gracilibacteria bacterium]